MSLTTKPVHRPDSETVYDQLTDRQKVWIESVNPQPVPTLGKPEILAYLRQHGLPVTPYAIKIALGDGELPSKMLCKKRVASEFDALVWAITRTDNREPKRVSA